MPVARVQLPDGRVARLEVPQGTTPEQVESFVMENYHSPTGGFGENLAAGAGQAIADTARGAKQVLDTPAAFIEKALDGGKTAKSMGMETVQESAERTNREVAESRKRDKLLSQTAGGKIGNVAGNVALTLPALAIPGANTYKAAATVGGLMGLTQPTAEGESRLVNTGLGAAAGTVGKFLGDKVAGFFTKKAVEKQAQGAAQKAAGATRDATLKTSREAGYVVPPTQANPNSAWNQILESFSGKIKTGQAASVKNQAVTNRLAKEAIGLTDDATLTKEALKAVRTQAGQAYDDVASFGKYTVDDTFINRITTLADSQRTLAKEVPELADKEVLGLAESLSRKDFDGRTVIELTKALREKASKAFRDGASDAGRFYRGAADEVEDLIERNLMQSGHAGIEAFRQARQQIAKTYTIEAALNESTGNVVGSKLAAQLTKGKPLSGSLKKAAKFAQAFPDSARDVSAKGSSSLQLSPLDWAVGAGTAGATGNPAMMAGLLARPTVRSLILSKPYQSAMANPSYATGEGMRTVADFLTLPATRKMLPGAASAGSLVYARE